MSKAKKKNNVSYDFVKRKKLLEKMKKIKNAEYNIEFFNILISDPKCKFSKNDNGVFFIVNQFSDKTFEKLDKYIQKISKELMKKKINANLTETIKLSQESESEDSSSEEQKSRLTKKEKRLLSKFGSQEKAKNDTKKNNKNKK